MVILIGTLLGIGCGCALGVIISRIIINKRMMKLEEEERIRELEKQLSVVAEKCDRTQKACRLLSDIVKDNYKTEKKEEYKVPFDKLPHSVAEKIDRFDVTQRILSNEDIMNIYPDSDFAQSLISVLSQQECQTLPKSQNTRFEIRKSGVFYAGHDDFLSQQICSVEENIRRNLASMTCLPAEEAQKRLLHAYDWGITAFDWGLRDDPD